MQETLCNKPEACTPVDAGVLQQRGRDRFVAPLANARIAAQRAEKLWRVRRF